MVKTLNLVADIPANRELRISLHEDFPEGPADIILVISPSKKPRISRLADLRESKFFGIRRDRSDICNSVDFARDLRSEGWKRSAS